MPTAPAAIIQTSANELFRVEETGDPAIAHCWRGIAVKRAGGGYAPKAKARAQLVRKAGCRIVAEAIS